MGPKHDHSQSKIINVASIKMTYKSQMEEKLHHPPQRLGLLLEANNTRKRSLAHQVQNQNQRYKENLIDFFISHTQITPTLTKHHVQP